jgi:hypothetical protein
MLLYLLFLLLFHFSSFRVFFSNTLDNGIGSGGVVNFACSNGQRICFQWCPFDSEHGFIAFLLQWGIQFGVGVGVAKHHFPVLKLTHE